MTDLAVRSHPILPFSQLKDENAPAPCQVYSDTADQLMDWVYNYLCKPHPELGRPGPVCPFVPGALEKDTFFVTICAEQDLIPEVVHQLLLQERERFLDMEPRLGNDAQFKTTLILFPNIPCEEAKNLIDKTQARLREDFCKLGLMVGEFHDGPPDKGGLWNSNFRPLQCPVPLMAIRHMVPTDILFLKKDRSLVAEYLKRFNDMVPARYKEIVEETARRFGFDMPDPNEKKKGNAPNVLYMLEKSSAPYKLHRHAMCENTIRIPSDFAQALGYPVERITKALFLRNKARTIYLMAICPAEMEPDLSALAEAMGVRELEFADEMERKQKVGHPPQSMTPLGTFGIATVIDESLMSLPTILTGSGVSKMEIEIDPKHLRDLTNAATCSFAEASHTG